eukprot:TRINITY_DN8820_c0_g1_i2.p1 TRINITY_DN8820_c0_g1~~TRINITY_DN8820_c0_g1_i2.p1  ORF type:complete len:300 (+),score=28.16 TRINITY_DN8820_c0_g1_i2:102-1001(+)
MASHRSQASWSWMPTISTVRVLLIATLVTLLWQQKAADTLAASIWNYVRLQWWFQHDSLEPVVASLSFFPPLTLFYCLDMFIPSMHPWRISKNTSTKQWTGKEEFNAYNLLYSYLIPLMVFDYLFPRRQLPLEPPTVFGLLGQIILLLVLYDALFFVGHYTMHRVPWLYRHVHATHHDQAVTRAYDTLRLSYAEQFIDVACSIAAVNIVGAHPLARAIYNIIIVYLLCELHSGYDLPWMLHNIVPGDIMGGPLRHDRHHMDGRFYYQKFFTYLDNAIGAPPTPEGPCKKLELQLQARDS